ncbi:hypothetical protein ARALYDRAFT_493277 [Arabidopsis lyrata subsp. lyrata]|uniref:Uncharacterized protein n=1 Tax=Arabidopsis lyrata subsp. lyrata TaxID=81972 RepID=D7MA83_ARALL|nr:hypothetical protein ARALYDRAFT_493277 [Arabidopsis lyrata subsp. lyrata]
MDVKTKLELENSSVKDLLGMTKLRTLTVHSLDSCTLETLSASLRESRELEHLSLYEVMHGRHNEGKLVLDSIHLKFLTVGMHMTRLPDQHRFPPNLAHICLRYCCMEEDPMPILEKLLHLKFVELSYRAFTGKRMELPDELIYITSLKELTIGWRDSEWGWKLSERGQDHYKVHHIPVFILFTRPLSNFMIPRLILVC